MMGLLGASPFLFFFFLVPFSERLAVVFSGLPPTEAHRMDTAAPRRAQRARRLRKRPHHRKRLGRWPLGGPRSRAGERRRCSAGRREEEQKCSNSRENATCSHPTPSPLTPSQRRPLAPTTSTPCFPTQALLERFWFFFVVVSAVVGLKRRRTRQRGCGETKLICPPFLCKPAWTLLSGSTCSCLQGDSHDSFKSRR